MGSRSTAFEGLTQRFLQDYSLIFVYTINATLGVPACLSGLIARIPNDAPWQALPRSISKWCLCAVAFESQLCPLEARDKPRGPSYMAVCATGYTLRISASVHGECF